MMKLKLNQKVTMIINDPPYNGEYQSRIEDLEEGIITMALPTDGGVLIPIRVGTNVTLVLMDEMAAYEFDSVIIEREMKPIPILRISVPNQVKRIQRREYVRLDITLPTVIDISDNRSETAVSEIRTETLEISGGGCRLGMSAHEFALLEEYIGRQDKPQFRLVFDVNNERGEKVSVHCLGKVHRTGEFDRKKWIAVEYKRIDEKTREEIIRFVYRKQVEHRSMGLLKK